MCGNDCTKPEKIVASLEKADADELLAYWRNLPKERKDAIKRKLMKLAFA